MRSLRSGFGGLRGSVGGWIEVGGSLFCVFYKILEVEMEREGYELVIYNVLITSDIASKELCRCEIFIVQEGALDSMAYL